MSSVGATVARTPGLESLDSVARSLEIPRRSRVYVNRNLRLDKIETVGFDMDYTLAIYRQQEMDSLSVELMVERMIQRGYPAYLKKLRYDTRFPIRGP